MTNREVFITTSFILILILAFISQGSAKINFDGLAGLWLFDEGSGKVAKDSSGNDRHGEAGKALKWINGKFGKAVEFDGGRNYIIIEHDDVFNFEADDFSVGCWVEAENKDAYVIIKRNGGGFWALSASIDRESGVFIFEGGGQHVDDGKTVIVGKGWHHCVVVRKKGKVSLYVDGKLDTERNGPANMDNPAPLKFGGWGSENHKGGLDEVFLFKKGIAFRTSRYSENL